MHVLGKKAIPASRKNGPVTDETTAPAPAVPAAEADTPLDMLDHFAKASAQGNRDLAIMMLFWKARHQDAEPFTVNITPADIKGFQDCIEYLEVKPQVRIFRPQGRPAHPGAPATDTRSAIPPTPAGKPKDYVVIQLVDEHGDAFVPIENNEADLQKSQETQRVRRIRESAPQLAATMVADVQSNTISSSTIMEAAEALKLLARA